MSDEHALFGIHASALRLRSQRMAVLASNIANATTPNFKARDFNFTSALRAAQADPTSTPQLEYRVPVQASLDGNTVELPTEQLEFTEKCDRLPI